MAATPAPNVFITAAKTHHFCLLPPHFPLRTICDCSPFSVIVSALNLPLCATGPSPACTVGVPMPQAQCCTLVPTMHVSGSLVPAALGAVLGTGQRHRTGICSSDGGTKGAAGPCLHCLGTTRGPKAALGGEVRQVLPHSAQGQPMEALGAGTPHPFSPAGAVLLTGTVGSMPRVPCAP